MSDATTDPDGEGPENDVVVAAEYVLRLQTPAERRAFEARLDLSGALRTMVVMWQEQFAQLAERIAPVTPPVELRARVAAAVAPQNRAPESRSSGWSFGGILRGALGGLALGAAAVALLAILLPRVEPPVTGPTYVAELQVDETDLQVEVTFDSGDEVLRIARLSGETPPGQVLEVWLLAADGTFPHSVGFLPETGERVIEDVPLFWGTRIPGGAFAISVEPEGGSQTDLPSGPIVAVGTVSEN